MRQRRTCRVGLASDGKPGHPSLHLTVADDGTGDTAVGPGTGLQSMRERAEELGRHLHGDVPTGPGTEVEACLPTLVGVAAMIRVLVADDHPVFRRGLVGVLAEDPSVEVVGEAADGDDRPRAGGAVPSGRGPDGPAHARHGGVEATKRLAAEQPDVAVLVLSMLEDDESVHAALQAGARGYLVKGADGERIADAVRSVAAGRRSSGRTSPAASSASCLRNGARRAAAPSRCSPTARRSCSP